MVYYLMIDFEHYDLKLTKYIIKINKKHLLFSLGFNRKLNGKRLFAYF
jgi:hypothetical protein